MTDRIFCHFGPFFVLLPPYGPRRSKCWKNENIFILQMCTINDNHMMYGSWDMECDRLFCLSFWTIFCTFTNTPSPLTTQKIKIFKKWKKTPGDIITLHKCKKNHDHMLPCSWDTMRDRCSYLSIGLFFALLPPPPPPPKNLKNQELKKMKNTPGDIIMWNKNNDH